MDAQHLISLQGVTVERLAAGLSTQVGCGTLSLSLLTTTPSPAYGPPSTLAAKPPLPPRPSSPIPPPLPPRLDTKAAPSQPLPLAPPPLPRRPSSPGSLADEVTDVWLILQLIGPSGAVILELPVPATSRILSTPPSSYVIPADSSLGGGDVKGKEQQQDGSGFIKITLPPTIPSNEREELEHHLANFASFAEPIQTLRSRLVLVDEGDGTIIGELSSKINEDPLLALEGSGSGSKEPVVVDVGGEAANGLISVRPISAWKATENPTGSKIISLGDFVSHGLIMGAEVLGRGMSFGASKIVEGTKATDTPLVFSERTKSYVASGHKGTATVVKVSGKTVELIGEIAAKLGDTVGKSIGIQTSPSGKQPTGIRGVINRSLIAFNAVADSVSTSGKALIDAGSSSSATVVGHRYGEEAQDLTKLVGGSVKHVALVYIDARGITRKALLKSVGKSAIRAKMADGREVVLTAEK